MYMYTNLWVYILYMYIHVHVLYMYLYMCICMYLLPFPSSLAYVVWSDDIRNDVSSSDGRLQQY